MTSKDSIGKTKIIIVDDSLSFRVSAADALTKNGFDVIEATENPRFAVEAIRTMKPDIVLFDVVLAQIDGIAFLKEAMKVSSPAKTHYIAISTIANDVIIREVMRLGASYYIVKPVDYDILRERIDQICNRFDNIPDFSVERVSPAVMSEQDDDMERQVTSVILEIGIPAHVKGYHYVRSAILLAIQSPDVINAVTKGIYPTIAKQYHTSSSRVERAIRHAIEVAWDRGNVDTLNSFFGYSISSTRGKPTNSEFIAMISDRLRLRNKKNLDSLSPSALK